MLHPAMLLGLLGLSVPVIIHLIQRQRLRSQPLSTLEFLDREDLANAFAPVPRDLVQLLLRLLLLGLFVLLMCRLASSGGEPGPRTLAIVVDQSMSMRRHVSETESAFEQAKRQALELVDSLREGDRASLTLVGDDVTRTTGLLSDRGRLRAELEECAVSDSGSAGLSAAVRAAIDQLRARRSVNACVVVFSDRQRDAFAADLREEQPPLRLGHIKLLWIDVPGSDRPNLGIERAAFAPPRAYVGGSSRLTTVVRNGTDKPQPAALLIGGEQGAAAAGEERTIELAPGEAAHVDLVQRFDSPLDSIARVELPDDLLPGDNAFYVPMRMRDRRQVLLVAEADPDEESQTTAVRFGGIDLLRYALNPGEAVGQGSGTQVNVKRVAPQGLPRVSLPLYAVIVLYGVVDLPEQSYKDLRAFAAGGGLVWVIVSPDASPARFNERFASLLDGLTIGGVAETETPRGLSIVESDLQDPLLLPLVRDEWGPAGDVFFSRTVRLETPGGSRPLLRAATGDVLMALLPLDRGHVLVQAFDCDLASSSLPRTAAFVPLVQRVVHGLADEERTDRVDMLRVSQTARIRLPEFRGLQGDVLLTGPEQRSLAMVGPDRDEVRLTDLRLAGGYTLAHAARPTGRQRQVAVNASAGESNLTPLSDADLAALYGEAARLVPFGELDSQFRRGREWTWPLVWLVLAALVVEALAGAWQSRRRVAGGGA
ncbi:MAG: VWA domain-containing protein [Planctomycetia bacterium]